MSNVEDSIDAFDTRTGNLNEKNIQSCSARNRESNATIIFCNPNAGLYEFMYYEVNHCYQKLNAHLKKNRANGLSFMSIKG